MQSVACLAVDEAHAVGSSGNTLIVVWRDPPASRAIDGVSRAAKRLLGRFPGGIGCIEVALDAPLAGAACGPRSRLLCECGGRLVGLASVIEGNDFVAGTTRRVVSAIDQVAKHPCPLRVFGTVDEAVAWMAPLVGEGRGARPTSAVLRHAIEALRRKLTGRRPRVN
jgi:hypothetical protein